MSQSVLVISFAPERCWQKCGSVSGDTDRFINQNWLQAFQINWGKPQKWMRVCSYIIQTGSSIKGDRIYLFMEILFKMRSALRHLRNAACLRWLIKLVNFNSRHRIFHRYIYIYIRNIIDFHMNMLNDDCFVVRQDANMKSSKWRRHHKDLCNICIGASGLISLSFPCLLFLISSQYTIWPDVCDHDLTIRTIFRLSPMYLRVTPLYN